MSNYLIIYNDVTGTLDKKVFHEKITKHLGVTDWWHYIPNGYIVTTPVPSADITNSLSKRFPGLLFLIIEVNVNDTSGVLPKEAFDWIGKKKNRFVKIKQTPLPNIKITPSLAGGASGTRILRSILESGTKTKPQTIGDMLRSFGAPLPDDIK